MATLPLWRRNNEYLRQQRRNAELRSETEEPEPEPNPELIVNGTFDSASIDPWVAESGYTVEVVAGRLRMTSEGTFYGSCIQTVNTEIGADYTLSWEAFNFAGMRAGPPSAFGAYVNQDGSGSVTFTATEATAEIYLQARSNVAGEYGEWDNISLRKVIV